ncbi:TatD family hydrolase [Pedobacter cryophilus]|uniref:TatD family deoxyribonuclease n=1 Tax=Pedobacter cryophilus TaxID=2571271 RepID=A0A4U1C0V1_9SPHI|nr:TatD family hydrolase [Pedobacter cryophilus]TKB98574.1 TatD family deoxyribonuclease [Pedobacter cryophilus]
MILTDTHTHIYYETDPQKLEEQLQRCWDNQITRLFLPNVDSASIKLVLGLQQSHPKNCFPMLGLHPCDVKENFEEELNSIKTAIDHHHIYAIGEIGIDLYWDKSLLKEQQIAFKKQILWAKELDLPIVIHCREAFDEVFEILEEMNDDKLRGIFHCFTGNIQQAQQAIKLGFLLGIGGVVTYKKAGLDLVVEQLELENLVLETDAPYLAPVPHRGKPNESSFLIHIAQKIADIKNMSLEEVAEITTANSVKVFGV